MVKQKVPGREPFRTPPIYKFFPRAQNNNNTSEPPTPISNKLDNENYSRKSVTPSKKSIRKDETPKRNKSGCATPETPFKSFNAIPDSSLKNIVNSKKEPIIISDDDDDASKSVPDVIEDDEVDHILSKAEKNPKMIKNNLRRSTRLRNAVNPEGFVPTDKAVPIRGDIPMFDDSSSSKPSYQNSLSALLREKRIRDKAGYNINVLEQALENDMLDEMEDPFDSYDRSEISAAILDEDAKFEHLRQILEEDDKVDQNHQIEFFGTLNSNPQIPNLQNNENNDPTFDLLLKVFSDEEKLKDILCNNWIAYQFEIGWQLPTEVVVWLLHLASYGEDKIISEASFNILNNIAEVKGSYSFGPKNEAGDINVPFFEIYNILTALGASKQIFDSKHCLEQNIKQSEVLPKFPYINNIRQLLKTLVPMINSRLFMFSSPEEIRSAIVVFLRLPLDKRLLSLSSEIEKALNSLLDMFQEDQWIEQAEQLYEAIKISCGSITQFKVTILENLPISSRGRLLRRFFALRFLFESQQINILDVTEPKILNSLLDLFQDSLTIFKIRDETNYTDLYNYVVFLDYALDDESQLRKAKDTVEEIIKKLKYLHGKIVDIRAAFMERTRAKDLIQRLYMRLYYISNHRRGKTQTSIQFYSPKKNLEMDVDKEN